MCLVSAGVPAWAMDPSLDLSEMHRTRWTTREGSPSDVTALAQTADGALWLGASTGLVRFDGVRFERFRPRPGEAALAEDISALFTTADGDLWIGARLGGVHVLRRGQLTSYGPREGLPTNTVLAFARRPDGSFWAGTTNGLYRLDGTRWRRVGAETGFAQTYVSSLLVDSGGTLWATGLQGTFALAPGAASFTTALAGAAGLGMLRPGPGDRPWLSNRQLGVRALGSAAAIPNPMLDDGPGAARPTHRRLSSGTAFLFDRDGGFWAAVDDGLVRIADPPGRRAAGVDAAARAAPSRVEHLAAAGTGSADRIWALLEDREGDVWLGTADGLERLRPVKLRRAPQTLGPLGGAALALGADGTPWAATEAGDRVELATGRVTPRVIRDGAEMASFAIGADATQWMGGVGALLRIDATGVRRVAAPEAGTVVQAVSPDAGGGAWVSVVRGGLYRWRNNTWTLAGGVRGLPEGAAMCLRADVAGRLWAGYTGARLALVEGGEARTFGPETLGGVGAVLAIAPQGDHAWIGGAGGLALLRAGQARPVRRTGGGDITGVSGIVTASNGELWLNGAAGITRIPAPGLARFLAGDTATVDAETFDFEDGLEGAAPQLRPLPSAIEDRTGRLWFTTSRNVVSIDPRRIPRNPIAPSVRVLGLTADGREQPARPGLALPERTRDFQIDYTAFSLAVPERVRFRYRLDGVDDGWRDAGPRRQAFYTNVPPGHYTFRVTAANEDGLWSTRGDSIDFDLLPAFWQTAWFAALGALALLVLLWSLYTLRLRQLAARLAGHLGARQQERERIARELHDTLLQGTQGLILNFQGIALQLPPADPMRTKMEALLDRADLILAEARDRVRDLRQSGLAAQALPEAIARVAADLSGDGAPMFRAFVEGTPRELAPALQAEALQIAREALVNAFTHAGATAIEAHVVYGSLTLLVRIRDDGCGIDPAVLVAGERSGHWGLVGMRERVRRFGARLDLWSRPGAGTEVALGVPAAVAYRRRAPRRWFGRRGADPSQEDREGNE